MKAKPFVAVASVELGALFLQCLLELLDEFAARTCPGSQGLDCFPFGTVFCDDEDFAPGGQPGRSPFDKRIGSLARWRVEHFDRVFRLGRGGRAASVAGIEKDAHWHTGDVLVEGEDPDQGVAGLGGMAGVACGQFGPLMEQAVPVNQNSDQCHRGTILRAVQGENRKKEQAFGSAGY